jgi:16S rRNA (guanine966-N2)-methyltransferase
VSSLFPGGFLDARVLDVFAGSGALGLEALSRGASRVTFCERDHKALATLRANRDLFDKEQNSTTILAVDVFAPKALKLLKLSGPYDLVLLDPPYACAVGKIKTFLRSLVIVGALSAGALITYECLANKTERLEGTVLCSACSPASLHMVSCKVYGTTQVEYLRYW